MTIQKEWQDWQDSLVDENNDLDALTEELDQMQTEMRKEWQIEAGVEATHFCTMRDRRLDKYRI
jgi:peptidoglycan hydrolase CwlO-like protein